MKTNTDDKTASVEPERRLAPVAPRYVGQRDRKRWKRGIAGLFLVTVVATVVWSVANLLGDAALFFYNADEAVSRRDELASRRFRIQGTPLAEPESDFQDGQNVLKFLIGFNDVVVDVVHVGDPAGLFQVGVPVVLEGAWRQTADSGAASDTTDAMSGTKAWFFSSDRMLVKHDNEYRKRQGYDDRISEANRGVATTNNSSDG
ncbi:MAG: cytochrome c maturation protein CcmE [Acidimicrobiaceae bacterium]|nr:cytochrome c maturation protein CcmE [Acidimicrobiaceae bacterium]